MCTCARGDDASAEDALTYLEAVARGESGTKAIAKSRDCTPRTATGRIGRARRRGMLTKAINSRSISEITLKGANLLDELHPGWRDAAYPKVEPSPAQVQAALEIYQECRVEGVDPTMVAYRVAKAVLNT